MAIFTSVANYLKCRNYFESVLGFRLADKYNDESQSDYDYDINGFDDSFGVLRRKSNRIVAHNIWFLYGKSQPWGWSSGDEEAPKEIEKGFVIRDDTNPEGNIQNDACGFVLDPAGSLSGLEFIGMKRLLPVNYSDLDNPSAISEFKDIIKFAKLIDGLTPEKLLNYDTEITPTNGGVNGLNAKQPNSLVIKTSYDYNDFGFNETGKEYNVRQIGMLTNLHLLDTKQSFVANHKTLYNGLDNVNLCDLFNISENAILIPQNLDIRDRFTSLLGGNFDYSTVDPQLQRELDLTDGGSSVRTNSAISDNNVFFGILQFYINTMPNNRITFQLDTYNFILSFENQIKCNCTCDTCNCPKD